MKDKYLLLIYAHNKEYNRYQNDKQKSYNDPDDKPTRSILGAIKQLKTTISKRSTDMITRTGPATVPIEMWYIFGKKEKPKGYDTCVKDRVVYGKHSEHRSQLIKLSNWRGTADA